MEISEIYFRGKKLDILDKNKKVKITFKDKYVFLNGKNFEIINQEYLSEEPGESKVCSTVRPRMCILRKFVAVQQQCQRKIRIRAGAGTGTAAAIIELSITNLTNQIGLGDKLRNHSASHASADATK